MMAECCNQPPGVRRSTFNNPGRISRSAIEPRESDSNTKNGKVNKTVQTIYVIVVIQQLQQYYCYSYLIPEYCYQIYNSYFTIGLVYTLLYLIYIIERTFEKPFKTEQHVQYFKATLFVRVIIASDEVKLNLIQSLVKRLVKNTNKPNYMRLGYKLVYFLSFPFQALKLLEKYKI